MKNDLQASGGCHCGNIRYVVELPVAIADISARHCSCSYCTRHGAIYGAHPDAHLVVTIRDQQATTRYQFASKTTDFLICTHCGIPTLVLDEIEGKIYALLKLNTLDEPPAYPDAPRMSMEGEDESARRYRRPQTWIGEVRIMSPP